jgi:hypothetical protein
VGSQTDPRPTANISESRSEYAIQRGEATTDTTRREAKDPFKRTEEIKTKRRTGDGAVQTLVQVVLEFEILLPFEGRR